MLLGGSGCQFAGGCDSGVGTSCNILEPTAASECDYGIAGAHLFVQHCAGGDYADL